MNTKILYLMLIIALMTSTQVSAQETKLKRTSITTRVGLAVNNGEREVGAGLISSVGWQKSFGKKHKLRLNPNIIFGSFRPLMSDTRKQFYKITSLGVDVHYDLIRYKSFSIVTTAGPFVNFSRGLLGTGGDPGVGTSEYFSRIYYGVNLSAGFRVDPKNTRLAFEFRPLSIQGGNNDFTLGYIMLGVDIKLY